MRAMTDVTALAGWELRGALRSRWVLGIAAVFAACSLAVAIFGLRTLRELGLTGVGAVADGLAALSMLLPPLLGLLLGASAIAGARERGELALLASQPVRRSSALLGAFVGLTAALWVAVLLGLGLAGLAIAGLATSADLPALGGLLGAGLAAAAASVALGLAVSTFAKTRSQATAGAVGLWFALALGLDLVLVVVAPTVRLGPAGLLLAVLANPLEAARILALLVAAPGGAALGPFGTYLVDRFGVGGGSLLLAADLAAWTVVPLVLAAAVLRRQDV